MAVKIAEERVSSGSVKPCLLSLDEPREGGRLSSVITLVLAAVKSRNAELDRE